MKKYVVLDKLVGETPLQCMENWRSQQPDKYQNIPLTYAGRLDPLASGKLLVLIGETCKDKERYLTLDKTYTVEVLFGMRSDSGDVLGIPSTAGKAEVEKSHIENALKQYTGEISLPYPAFSSKPVNGKPLHTWAAEGRLNEVTIPVKQSTVYSLTLKRIHVLRKDDVFQTALARINSIPPVTELRKALGNDFRRDAIRAEWHTWLHDSTIPNHYTVATISCTCSSGTYMRSLAEAIGSACGTTAVALSIHRNAIGHFKKFGPFSYVSSSF